MEELQGQEEPEELPKLTAEVLGVTQEVFDRAKRGYAEAKQEALDKGLIELMPDMHGRLTPLGKEVGVRMLLELVNPGSLPPLGLLLYVALASTYEN